MKAIHYYPYFIAEEWDVQKGEFFKKVSDGK